jgi:hypothetical protein
LSTRSGPQLKTSEVKPAPISASALNRVSFGEKPGTQKVWLASSTNTRKIRGFKKTSRAKALVASPSADLGG